jgi:hypothetical protein
MGSGSNDPQLLTSALDGDELLAPLPVRFTTGKRVSGIHWIREWMGPRAGLDAVDLRPPAGNRALTRHYADSLEIVLATQKFVHP